MLLVDCATKRGSVDHQLRALRTQRSLTFLGATFALALYFSFLFCSDPSREFPLEFLALFVVGAFQWTLSTRKIQLLLLIRHYRKED